MVREKESDPNAELARLQKQIYEYLGMPSDNLLFDFRNQNNQTQLDLITVNPRHNQSFLFHSTLGIDKVEATQKMLEYLKDYRAKENSYTIQWAKLGENELHTSYFRSKNIYQALDKLYYGRDMNTITVYSVVLNPIS